MLPLFAAAVFLPLSHYGLSSTGLRDALVKRLGERGYLGLYSLVAFGAFYFLVSTYRQAPLAILWIAPDSLKLAIFPIVLVTFLLAVIGVTTPNPTAVGAENLLSDPNAVRGILRVTRNPFLWGASLWALAHLIVRGDIASLLLFGSVAVLGLAGMRLLEAKKRRRHGADWTVFAALTSNIPFQAILEGRQQLVWSELGWWRVVLAVALFAVALWGHRWAFGVSPIPM
ncbi:MAG TPA: NnrU family protein [Candidatus Binatia bacterium]|nr:NnrU family protein [Candidatus Binatia bacterium]